MITPHIAAITPAKEAAEVIVENYKRAMSGMELLFEVDRDKGY
jgi:glyoxylate/hydroxypyruvate reductase A